MLIRVITAIVLFMVLAKANLWADTKTHLVLAVGYRTFLLAAPFFMYFGIANGMRSSLLIGALALGFSLYSFNYIAMGLFALSMAVSGYISKYVNSNTSRGAADNKVSLNVGSLIAGGLVALSADKSLLLSGSIVLLLYGFYLAMKIPWNKILESEKATENLEIKTKVQMVPLVGWILIGVATGIKLTGIFSILPQYLIHKTGSLPSWYGSMIILNSVGVIFFQHKILNYLGKSKKNMTFVFSISAMALLAMPAVMHVEQIGMAVIWLLLLTLGECALSRYDKLAKDYGYLFYKEIMVGVGSFITVYLSRDYSAHIYLSGFVGIISIAVGATFVRIIK